MIESSVLPQQAIDYLNSIQEQHNKEAEQLGRVGARAELLAWCNSWYDSARTWRKASYEDDWIKWQRNADGRYDPALASQKKKWQAKAFVDITPSHRENIQAELFRLVALSRPIFEVVPRPGGDPVQAENIKNLQVREMEKSRFEVEYNKIIEDKTTYGSGFGRYWFEERFEDRLTREPITEPLNILDIGSIRRHMAGQPIVTGYKSVVKPMLIYRGVRFEHVSVWDFFWDPRSLEIDGSPCLFRSTIGLQEILDRVSRGDFMPESAAIMREQASKEDTPPDKKPVQLERGIADTNPRREGNQKTWEYYELFARLPQKWVYPLLRQPLPITDADKLVPARVIFHAQTIFAVELGKTYNGNPPFLKDDYFPVIGRFMARGIPEMLKNPQTVVNEVVNQRLDEGNLALQQGFAVVEKAITNPEELEQGGPGLIVRLDQRKLGPNGDVRNAVLPLDRPDIKLNAGFAEVHEWERIAQERTSANRVTLGTQGLVHDSNRTLGGQQILKQTAGEKFAFIAALSEFTFLYQVFRAYWSLIYQNLTPEDVMNALGQERAQTFQLLSPEQVELSYCYEPKGIFEREAKAEMQGRLSALWDQFKGMPGLDPMAFFDQEAKSFNINPDRLKTPKAELEQAQALAQKIAEPMAKSMVSDIVLGLAVKQVERNMAEHLADASDGAKPRDGERDTTVDQGKAKVEKKESKSGA